MKKRNLLLAALLGVATVSGSFAQTNLGQDCGCPAVGSRPRVVLSDYADANGQLSASMTLTCDKTWFLDKKIYVPDGKVLTINPGTVIKARVTTVAQAANATALIVSRGGKIMAAGTKSCPIVFTDSTDMLDGNSPVTNVGKWGGVAICGIAPNNLNFTLNGPSGKCVADGVGYLEGFAAGNPWNHYGAGPDGQRWTSSDPNDNSGVLTYVSIRHPGANLKPDFGNELNGLTLASVGRGTKIENIEVVASADDNVEVFGGTVNLKNIATLWGDDDMLDYDQGYSGKIQFFFGIATDSISAGTTNLDSNDNGIEADADDSKGTKQVADGGANAFKSTPSISNITLVGNGHIVGGADNTGAAGIMAKECTGGIIANSIFVNFRTGAFLSQVRSGTDKGDAYDNWVASFDPAKTASSAQSLKICNNTFVNCGSLKTPSTKVYPLTKGTVTPTKGSGATFAPQPLTNASASDTVQFVNEGNVVVSSVDGLDYTLSFNGAKTALADGYAIVPRKNIATNSVCLPFNDNFFTPVSYRGAFDANSSENWLSGWAQSQVLSISQQHPTDFDKDGDTDVYDYGTFTGDFGKKY